MSKSIKIAGAGLGGLSAAVLLADNFEVDVFEAKDRVGFPSGDDIQAVRNYGMKNDQFKFFEDNGLSFDFFHPIKKIVKYAPSGKSMVVKSENGPLFYSFKRGPTSKSLEQQLYAQALGKGVNFSFNSRKSIKGVDIVSTGAIYRNIWAYGALYKDVSIDQNTIHFFMDNTYCPQGYIYAIPYGKKEVAIAATTYDTTCPLPRLFKKFLIENKVIGELINGGSFVHNTSGYAYSNVPASADINGTKFVGGAAGFVEAARGFGVKYAIESGIYCAKSITEKKSYDSLWKTAFESELLDGFRRRLLLEKFTNADYEMLLQGDEVTIGKYRKIPVPFSEQFDKIKNSYHLSEWRKKYSLEKLIL